MTATTKILNDQQARAYWSKVGILKQGESKILKEFDLGNWTFLLSWAPTGLCDLSSKGAMITHTFSLVTKTYPGGVKGHRLVLGNLVLWFGRKGQTNTLEMPE